MAQIFGSVKKFPVSCGAIVTPVGFIVVRNTPFDASVGSTTLQSLQVNLDLKRQQVNSSSGEKKGSGRGLEILR